jgi:uncharacterized membrane protein
MREVVVLLHVLGALAFLLSHAVSMYVSFRVRGESDRARVAQLLQLSGRSLVFMYAGLGVLLLAGIIAAFLGDYWGTGWLWASIGILVVVLGVMFSVASPFYNRMRAAATGGEATADLGQVSTTTRPFILATVGGIGFVAIVWLMIAKPF